MPMSTAPRRFFSSAIETHPGRFHDRGERSGLRSEIGEECDDSRGPEGQRGDSAIERSGAPRTSHDCGHFGLRHKAGISLDRGSHVTSSVAISASAYFLAGRATRPHPAFSIVSAAFFSFASS